jgi:hypothetical protein
MKNIGSKVRRLSGWFAFFLLIVNIVSGLGWDIRTSDFVYLLTSGLVNRATAADMHTFTVVPIVLLMLCHITLSFRRFRVKE